VDKKTAISTACKIDGWLTPPEASQLYDLAKDATGPIVEIGAWQGRSTTCLAHGSMAGNKQPVYTIDHFEGSQDGMVIEEMAKGNKPSEALLRANLDKAGCNGLVKILPMGSAEAISQIPSTGMLFVDGGHGFEIVSRDLQLYLPKVKRGGVVALHDCEESGVSAAIQQQFAGPDKRNWIRRFQEDKTLVFSRAVSDERFTVMLGMLGESITWQTTCAVLQLVGSRHRIHTTNSGNGWDDFNAVWAQALNAAEVGEVTHFCMLHSDVAPQGQWLDILLDELDRLDLDMVSAISPIKDSRGVTSSGIGDPQNRWEPFRRFTMQEVCGFPETFDAASVGYEGWPLLHNTGCWVCDLRKPLFFETDDDKTLKAYFDFPSRVHRGEDGLFTNARESEDWYFSRCLTELNAKTAITRKVRLSHRGFIDYTNWEPWGKFEHDEDTERKWNEEGGECPRLAVTAGR
jgi:predicted O-methyltransferase YrrM